MYVLIPNIDDLREVFETAKTDAKTGLILLFFLQLGAMNSIKETFGL